MLDTYTSQSGHFDPVWTLEIQTPPSDTDKIIDAVMKVTPLSYGRYQRNAAISAVGTETSCPQAGSVSLLHNATFSAGMTETFPMVTLRLSIDRDVALLEKVMDAILYVHVFEQPVIHLREAWASRANYTPDNTNPNRWWNNAAGLPDPVK